jgi:hypothetical protein
VPAHDEHPLDRFDLDEEDKDCFAAFSTFTDPFFFHFCESLNNWNHVAAFNTGLIVFSEDFPKKDQENILKYDINFVLYKQLAWPLYWCIGTELVEICVGWTDAQKR